MKQRIIYILLFVLAITGCQKDIEHTSLLGAWNCEEFPEQTSPRNYQVSISRNLFFDTKNEYKISNFYKLGNSEDAEVYFYQDTISEELIIEAQTVKGVTIHGSGKIEGDFSKIYWTYYVNSGSVFEKVEATYY